MMVGESCARCEPGRPEFSSKPKSNLIRSPVEEWPATARRGIHVERASNAPNVNCLSWDVLINKGQRPAGKRGSRLAAKARKLASKLTPEQRRAHFNKAMAMIYGGAKAEKATVSRH